MRMEWSSISEIRKRVSVLKTFDIITHSSVTEISNLVRKEERACVHVWLCACGVVCIRACVHSLNGSRQNENRHER
jgi:hypothetical protein